MKDNALRLKNRWIGGSVSALLCAASGYAAEITVMMSRALTPVYQEVAPQFERETQNKLVTSYAGSTMGGAPDSILSRLQRGDAVDVVIVGSDVIDALVKQGWIVSDSRVDLARSGVGLAVRAGAPKPDIRSVDALKRTLLQAKSIALSEFYSGIYLSTELFQNLGIAVQVRDKIKLVKGEPVGVAIARGDAEIGFQQISELLPVPGIDYVGPLPAEAQKFTVFSAGVAKGAREPDAAKALIKFLGSPSVVPVFTKRGLEPMAAQ